MSAQKSDQNSNLPSPPEQEFDSLSQMMTAYAEQAAERAQSNHGISLDYSPASVDRLDTILAAELASSSEAINLATRLWGGYLGEVFCRHHGGEWIMALYPGSELSMPSVQVGASQLYPLLKVQRRLTMGPGEEVAGFYRKVASALAARPATDDSAPPTAPTER